MSLYLFERGRTSVFFYCTPRILITRKEDGRVCTRVHAHMSRWNQTNKIRTCCEVFVLRLRASVRPSIRSDLWGLFTLSPNSRACSGIAPPRWESTSACQHVSGSPLHHHWRRVSLSVAQPTGTIRQCNVSWRMSTFIGKSRPTWRNPQRLGRAWVYAGSSCCCSCFCPNYRRLWRLATASRLQWTMTVSWILHCK